MPGSPPRVVWSHLFGREVLSDSGEWRHECEVEYLLALPEAKRAEILDGVPGTTDQSQGIKGVRGEAAVAALKVQIERLRLIKMKGRLWAPPLRGVSEALGRDRAGCGSPHGHIGKTTCSARRSRLISIFHSVTSC